VTTDQSTHPAIETVALTKRFGERIAVDAVNLSVPRGIVYGFLGHNGAGKTTLIRMLLGLTEPSGGEVRLLGRTMSSARADALARVGALVEEPRFRDHLTGRENLRVIADVRGEGALARIAPALARVGLSDRADERVKGYSLGMRQRLGVARALLADPELLILDEPTNGLDPGGIVEFRTMIRELAEQEGRTVFLSSHLLDEVEKVCDAAAIIDAGRVIDRGTIAELAGEGPSQLIVGCDDPDLAMAALDVGVGLARRCDGGVCILLDGDLHAAAAAVNTKLLEAGVLVWRLEPVRRTLEQRFLEITSRVGATA
jgi:ABC-2 type transport system ATP-binding protein